jgi:hypothetical protein
MMRQLGLDTLTLIAQTLYFHLGFHKRRVIARAGGIRHLGCRD